MRLLLALLLIIIGVLGIVAGVLYLTQPAHSLPAILPGYLAHATGKHTKRGIVAVAVGAVLLLAGAVVAMTGRRDRW
jgi:hypothetical protein